tara:strand:- start:257 stop:862 length:606 start_codon:yes stop_codon:yes gene_type:complete
MPDYQNGKIYKLWSPEGDDIYIGSTTETLCRRKAGHRTSFYADNNISSKVLFEKYTDVRIELIEECPCDNKSKLIAREGHYIRTLECVNKCVPDRTKQEYLKDNKEYYKKLRQDTKEHTSEYKKEYYKNNKEHIKERVKEYQENNKEELLEKMKQYRKTHYQNLKELKSEKITCECGWDISRANLARHRLSQTHIKLTSNM